MSLSPCDKDTKENLEGMEGTPPLKGSEGMKTVIEYKQKYVYLHDVHRLKQGSDIRVERKV